LIFCALVSFFAGASPIAASGQTLAETSPAARWTDSPLSDPNFFPLAVWLQAPANAERYREAGINTYIGLWKGPTEEQLAALREAGCMSSATKTKFALGRLDDPTIIAWMHGDEPTTHNHSVKAVAGVRPFRRRRSWKIIARCAQPIRRGPFCSISAKAWRGIAGTARRPQQSS